jgi:hypothetical protein
MDPLKSQTATATPAEPGVSFVWLAHYLGSYEFAIDRAIHCTGTTEV